jgi:thymidylate synthase (FAD)
MGTVLEPKVTLVSWTNNPIKAIASQLLNMQGKMVHNLDEISEEYAMELVRDLKKTALAGGLEVIDMLFQIENVPRSLTHQLVRTRVGAVYHQESLRFTTREDGFDYDMGATIKTAEQAELFASIMDDDTDVYRRLIELGVSMEDARGVLPINTLTKIGVKYNFKTLVHCGHVRLCYQSQGHWKPLFLKMKKEIEEKIHPVLGEFLVPICDVSGRCEYKGIFDRKCPKEDKLIKDTCAGCAMSAWCFNRNITCSAIKKFHRLE